MPSSIRQSGGSRSAKPSSGSACSTPPDQAGSASSSIGARAHPHHRAATAERSTRRTEDLRIARPLHSARSSLPSRLSSGEPNCFPLYGASNRRAGVPSLVLRLVSRTGWPATCRCADCTEASRGSQGRRERRRCFSQMIAPCAGRLATGRSAAHVAGSWGWWTAGATIVARSASIASASQSIARRTRSGASGAARWSLSRVAWPALVRRRRPRSGRQVAEGVLNRPAASAPTATSPVGGGSPPAPGPT